MRPAAPAGPSRSVLPVSNAWLSSTNFDLRASNCIDGRLDTLCESGVEHSAAWLRLELAQPRRVDRVALFAPVGASNFGAVPFELRVGGAVWQAADLCFSSGDSESATARRFAEAAEIVAPCGRAGSYVHVVLRESRPGAPRVLALAEVQPLGAPRDPAACSDECVANARDGICERRSCGSCYELAPVCARARA